MGRVTSPFLSRHSYVLGDIDIKYSITYKLFCLSVAKQLFNLLVLPTRHQPRSQFLSPTSLSQPQGRVGESMRREPRERGWLLFPGRSHAVLPGGGGTMRDSDPKTQTLGHGASQKETTGWEERKLKIFCFVFSPPHLLSPSSALVTNWLPYGCYFCFPQSSSVIKLKMAATALRIQSLQKIKFVAVLWLVTHLVDCKTVRIFAYSSTREQSNKMSGTRLLQSTHFVTRLFSGG